MNAVSVGLADLRQTSQMMRHGLLMILSRKCCLKTAISGNTSENVGRDERKCRCRIIKHWKDDTRRTEREDGAAH